MFGKRTKLVVEVVFARGTPEEISMDGDAVRLDVPNLTINSYWEYFNSRGIKSFRIKRVKA